MSVTNTFSHDGLLGTVVVVRVVAASESLADAVDQIVVGEIERLEAIFSAFDESSELCRWRRGEVVNTSAELTEVLAAAAQWIYESAGGFNPLAGELTKLWVEAEASGDEPTAETLAAVAAAIRTPRFGVTRGSVVQTGDCSALNLNAIAKGYIVDRALDAAEAVAAASICVNAGGDLAHRGDGFVTAGIENPHRPYDNEPPLATIRLENQALATSGSARRGFTIGTRWFGHVIDPLTGQPVDQLASISVIAPDAMTADVVATVAGVRAPDAAIVYLDGCPGVEGFVIDAAGQALKSAGWPGIK